MKVDYKLILWKMIFITIASFVLYSCAVNPIDKLLKEADDIINQKDFVELILQADSGDGSERIKAIANITRFATILDDLETQQKEMSVNQLEKYLILLEKIELISDDLFSGHNNVTRDINKPYIGNRPSYSIYTGIGPITTITRDNYTVTVIMHIGYDLDDTVTASELSTRQYELRDFVRSYFTGKYAAELSPENETEIKQNIIEILNTRFLDNGKISAIIFESLYVKEPN